MREVRVLSGLLLAALLVAATGTGWSDEAKKDDKKSPAKKEATKKKGTVVGVLTAKDEKWIEVKADGEEKARRYVPHWRGKTPSEGGGPDKKMLATFRKLKVGSRVRLEWVFEERPRVEKIEVLKAPAEKVKTDKK
jgi:hypothetical protein